MSNLSTMENSEFQPVAMTDQQRRDLFHKMLRIRKFEETTHELYKQGKLGGMSPHLCIGQEASAVGMIANLREDDYILSTHRGHGHCLAKGADMGKMYAELFGKETGYCRGRGGSMHIADVTKGNLGANGIVGGGLPIAVGAGLSIRYRGTDQVVVCFFGDAATNQGSFNESLNMAKAFNLPIIWACENNRYGLSTPIEKVSATPCLADRAKGYGMPGITVDGMDVEAVWTVAREITANTRQGGGPALIEILTYRYFGHGASDHRPYRTREEEQEWWTRCPLTNYRKRLLDKGVVSEAELQEVEQDVEREVAAGLAFALASPEPLAEQSNQYVYVEDIND